MSVLDIVSLCFELTIEFILIFCGAFIVLGITTSVVLTIFSIQDQGLPIVLKLMCFLLLLAHFGNDMFEKFIYILDGLH